MIVMGARGLGFVRATLPGSVSHGVLQASKVPVVIVSHPPPACSGLGASNGAALIR